MGETGVGRVVETVLLVDDWQPQLHQWVRECHAAGKRALCASSRGEAIELARRERPHLVIVDLFLRPPDNGLDVVRDLKAHAPDSFVILVSAHLSIDFAMLGRDAGASDCASKTVRCQQLIHRVEQGRRPQPEWGAVPTLAEVEWDHVSRVLNDCNGNITHAAEALGEHRFTLQRIIQRHAPHVLRPRSPRRRTRSP
jgi:two-component system, response regulator RegA